jgi:hypothetical protein
MLLEFVTRQAGNSVKARDQLDHFSFGGVSFRQRHSSLSSDQGLGRLTCEHHWANPGSTWHTAVALTRDEDILDSTKRLVVKTHRGRLSLKLLIVKGFAIGVFIRKA